MKIILSGVPCCSKTAFGDWLRAEHGFTHIDMEEEHPYFESVVAKTIHLGFPDWLSSTSKRIIVTWGFLPDNQGFEIINLFYRSGFEKWWFDGDADIARKKYEERDGVEKTKRFYDPQMKRISKALPRIRQEYSGRILNTLSASGYVALPEIYSSMLKVHRKN